MAHESAKRYYTDQIHYLRKKVTYADNGLTLTVGVIPAGSVVLRPISGVAVTTAFNAGTTNALDIGPSTDAGTDLWATALALGALNFVPLDEVVTNMVTVDTTVQCDVNLAGTAATAGEAEVIIAYVPPNLT